jgi:hypothetical protein
MPKLFTDSHLDNISYSFLIKTKTRKKLSIDWGLVRAIFFKYGEVVTPSGNIGKYKYFDPVTRYSYKIYGNSVTVSIAKKVFECYQSKESYYYHLVNAVQFLFDNEIIHTDRVNTRQASYYLLRSRGIVRIEHALDVYNLETSKQARKINNKGKRYQRKHFTRYEVILEGTIDKYRPQMKSIKLLPDFIDEVVKKQTKNILDKSTNTLLQVLTGETIGDNRQFNMKKIANWIRITIETKDYSLITDKRLLKQLTFQEKQNII